MQTEVDFIKGGRECGKYSEDWLDPFQLTALGENSFRFFLLLSPEHVGSYQSPSWILGGGGIVNNRLPFCMFVLEG